MKVTKQNYEQYLIDFMDGTLDPSLKKELFAFLDAHPDIKAEFEGLEMMSVNPEENVSYDQKDKLKKPHILATQSISEANYEEKLIASVENDLSADEEQELQAFLAKNPEVSKTYRFYESSKLEADSSIIYPDKKKLKKYPFYQKRVWLYTASAAASIILFLGLFGLYTSPEQSSPYSSNNLITEQLKQLPVLTAANIPVEDSNEMNLSFKSVEPIGIGNLDELLIFEEELKMMRGRIDPKQQLASLQMETTQALYIINFNNHHNLYLEKFSKSNYGIQLAQNKNTRVAKAIWGSLFGNLKNKKRVSESGKEDQNSSRVDPLWVLASIGLERVNEITGTNMRIKAKGGEAKYASNNEYSETDETYSSN